MNKIEYSYHDNYYGIWFDGDWENCEIKEVYVKNDSKFVDITSFYHAVVNHKIDLLCDKYEIIFNRDIFDGKFLIKEVYVHDIEITDFYEAIEHGKIERLLEEYDYEN